MLFSPFFWLWLTHHNIRQLSGLNLDPTGLAAEGGELFFGNRIVESGIRYFAGNLINVNYLDHRHLHTLTVCFWKKFAAEP